jgi:hypothetical protein
MKSKTIISVSLSIAILGLSFSTYANANVGTTAITPIDRQAETMLLAGKGKKSEHTSNARPSTANKHQKGQTTKQNAQINKQFKEAKKKNPKLDKKSFENSLKNK